MWWCWETEFGFGTSDNGVLGDQRGEAEFKTTNQSVEDS
jgi:hypothetical protein